VPDDAVLGALSLVAVDVPVRRRRREGVQQLSSMRKSSPVPSTPVCVAQEKMPSLTPRHSLAMAVIPLPSCQMQACVAFDPSSRECSMVALAPGLMFTTPLPLAPPALFVTQLLRMTTLWARTWMPPLTR
jgi:hypothetical protein